MAATTTPETLTNEEVVQVLALTKESDSVELKLTIPADAQRATINALDIDPLDAQIRQVFFFDTPELRLNASGVVVRARRVQGKGDDTVVKLRPVVPSQVPPELRESPNFGVELDASPAGHVCSGSLKGVPAKADVRHAVLGGRVSKLFSKEQQQLFAEHAPGGLSLDGPLVQQTVRNSPCLGSLFDDCCHCGAP